MLCRWLLEDVSMVIGRCVVMMVVVTMVATGVEIFFLKKKKSKELEHVTASVEAADRISNHPRPSFGPCVRPAKAHPMCGVCLGPGGFYSRTK